MSGAIEDRRQSALMLAFALEGATYLSKGLGQRKDVGGDEHIGVPGSFRMPVDRLRNGAGSPQGLEDCAKLRYDLESSRQATARVIFAIVGRCDSLFRLDTSCGQHHVPQKSPMKFPLTRTHKQKNS